MATPCSVNTIGLYLNPILSLLEVTNCDLQSSNSSFKKILYLINPVHPVKNSSRDGLVDFVDNGLQLTSKNFVQLTP